MAASPAQTSPTQAELVSADLQRILHVEVLLVVKLAQRRMKIGQVAKLNVGAIIELGKRSDEPLELVINSHVIGWGQAVTVGEKMGVQITRIADIRRVIGALGP